MARGRYEDLSRRRFGRLTVLTDSGLRQDTHVLWQCKCRCGSITLVNTSNLNSGNTLSCGCLQRDIALLTTGLRQHWRAHLKGA